MQHVQVKKVTPNAQNNCLRTQRKSPFIPTGFFAWAGGLKYFSGRTSRPFGCSSHLLGHPALHALQRLVQCRSVGAAGQNSMRCCARKATRPVTKAPRPARSSVRRAISVMRPPPAGQAAPSSGRRSTHLRAARWRAAFLRPRNRGGGTARWPARCRCTRTAPPA